MTVTITSRDPRDMVAVVRFVDLAESKRVVFEQLEKGQFVQMTSLTGEPLIRRRPWRRTVIHY